MTNLTEKDFFFCFTKKLSIYLKEEGISYIIKARSIKDNAIYTVYHKTDELQRALDKYKKIN
ncbi:hypothetical protein B1B04_12480 [Lysinibacillus sp. KCTC 33748]|uniref:DUF5659 domain-containing protein n=1 Tax=unclassified Lysinibacillus TaxID=2636778 RepID=UPI0009A733DD|nr:MULTISPECIES: DUF5659 domain-containing protein [unclassified Lysinibacillus]OXS73534.1 hypothetical protein B1B04_12480 [Lysinibacillus sp. KCTC 33748]SKB79644.1 hypothetical protein SAMN06295926_10898 [Lysinibacillus sp. AC-3]